MLAILLSAIYLEPKTKNDKLRTLSSIIQQFVMLMLTLLDGQGLAKTYVLFGGWALIAELSFLLVLSAILMIKTSNKPRLSRRGGGHLVFTTAIPFATEDAALAPELPAICGAFIIVIRLTIRSIIIMMLNII